MYDFDAGDLSLDFANTKNWHASAHPVEELKNYSDLLDWGQQAGLLTSELATTLKNSSDGQSKESDRSYEFAIQVREAIYRIFSHHYDGLPVPESDLALLNTVLRQAMDHMHLAPQGSDIRWQWMPGIDGANLIVWNVARAAAELLTSDKSARVRECEDDRGCGYLFVDTTKNHSRRWCSMESCGNRAKARRHYSRVRAN